MRCQYVSGLLLQCKNLIPPNAVASTTSTQATSSTADNTTNVYCEKHQSFIENVRARANVSRIAMDPGYKVPPHLLPNENALLSSKKTIPSYVFEPCSSESAAFSEDNPLRTATYFTDKEILQQYNAALGRMISRVNDMRHIIRIRYMEHLKKKADVKDERKKYRIMVRNADERALLERLKSDMAYARHNRLTATHLNKSYRKFKAESTGNRGNAREWLETPESVSGENRCDFAHKTNSTAPIPYVSPKIDNELGPEKCVKAVLDSIVANIVANDEAADGEVRCESRRIPMTNYCMKHIHLDRGASLVDKCTQCGEPCLGVDKKLCVRHAQTLFVRAPPPPPQAPAVQMPVPPTSQTITQRLPLAKDRMTRLSSINVNGWHANRQLPQQIMMRDGYHPGMVIRKPEIKYDLSALTGPLVLKSRRPHEPHQKILQSDRPPSDALVAEQSRLHISSSDNVQSLTIDEDVSFNELEKQCEQRSCLDTTPAPPITHQPTKAKRPTQVLRINGSNPNGIIIRGPIAVIPSPMNAPFNNNLPTANIARNGKINGIVQNGVGCARTRIYNRAERRPNPHVRQQ